LCERAGANYITNNPDYVIEVQIGFLEDLIAIHHPDGVIIHPIQESAVAPAVDKLTEAGIVCMSYDDVIPSENIVSLVYHQFAGEGVGVDILGQWFVEKSQELGKPIHIYEIIMDRSYESTWDRHDGLLRGIEEAGGSDFVTVTESPDVMHQDDIAANYVMDAFTADPTLNATFGGGGGSSGAPAGLQAIGRLYPIGHPDHIILTSCIGDPKIIEYMEDGVWDAAMNHGSWDLVDCSVQKMFNYTVLGQPVDAVTVVPMIVIDDKNMDTVKLYGCTPVWPKMPLENYELWPVLDFSEIGVEMPTKTRRMELLGY
jgi:ABC-type sugar transport system substrate-binding protein